MDGNVQFEREAATVELDDSRCLQAFYERSHSKCQTNTLSAKRTPQSASGPRLIETRATPTTA